MTVVVAVRDHAPAHAGLVMLVCEQRHQLVRSIMAVTKLNRHDAEDVLSTVTLRVLINGVSTEPESWFLYMREAARREASNARRGARREIALHTSLLPATADATVDAVAARMVWLDVMQAVERLPSREAEVVRMHYFDDLSYEQIAARLRLRRSGVASRMVSARRRLRQMMAERVEHADVVALLSALAYSAAGRLSRSARQTGAVGGAVGGAVATVSALSLLAVFVGPTLPLRQAGVRPPRPDAAAATGMLPPPRVSGDLAADRGEDGAGVQSARGAAPAHLGRPAKGLPPVVPRGVQVCLGPTCVGRAAVGDELRLNRVPLVRVGQAYTPVCWLVPDNPEVECRSGDPDSYRVPRPLGVRRTAVPSPAAPSPPDGREWVKGTSR